MNASTGKPKPKEMSPISHKRSGIDRGTIKVRTARPFFFPAIALAIALGTAVLSAAVQKNDEPQKTWDGSRTTPVHLIPLKDEFDQPIVPTETNPLPFSSRFSCAPCHDYDVIRRGLHFNFASAADPGRPGEPWVWVDEKTGTLLPISYRRWKGTWHPEEIGLTAWDFTLLFGRHLAGGGISEPTEDMVTPGSRWEVSGRMEINCLGCHNSSNIQDPSEWAKQVLRENFRWAATAASGLGEVGGMASRLAGTWNIIDGPNPDDTEWAVPPYVRYHRHLFDGKHRVFLDISRRPPDGRCLACHSTTPTAVSRAEFDEDVHSAAGLVCVACHRNDITHIMVRGYEGETNDSPGLTAKNYSCAGCHLGDTGKKGASGLAGRLGAPYPRHRGFPAVHFKRLSCTACHSGPWPEKEAVRVRTSRANRLGVYGIARWSTDLPPIFEPVFLRDQSGKLAPHRVFWPSYWAEMIDKKPRPLLPDAVIAAAGDILNPERRAIEILAALASGLEFGPDEAPALVLREKAYGLHIDGTLRIKASGLKHEEPEAFWAALKDSAISPLIPEFDPDSEDVPQETLDRVQDVLRTLETAGNAPGSPVLLSKKSLFELTEGYLEKKDSPLEPVARPRLAWRVGDEIRPLVSEFELRTIAALTGSEQTLTEEQVELVLKALARQRSENEPGTAAAFAYISAGRIFVLDSGQNLKATRGDAADPVTWPLAHQVRPARQSLGVNGCTDCHSVSSAFLFGRMRASGPLRTPRAAAVPANAFSRLDRPYQWLFGLSFAVRPLFKWALFFVILVAGTIVALVFFLALGRRAGLIEKRK